MSGAVDDNVGDGGTTAAAVVAPEPFTFAAGHATCFLHQSCQPPQFLSARHLVYQKVEAESNKADVLLVGELKWEDGPTAPSSL